MLISYGDIPHKLLYRPEPIACSQFRGARKGGGRCRVFAEAEYRPGFPMMAEYTAFHVITFTAPVRCHESLAKFESCFSSICTSVTVLAHWFFSSGFAAACVM